MLQITQRRQEGTLIAVYTGELDHHAAREAIEQTEDLLVLFPCEKLVLDLSELTFMDSSGLAVVLHLYRTCARRPVVHSSGICGARHTAAADAGV